MQHPAIHPALSHHLAALGAVSGPMRFLGSVRAGHRAACEACGLEVGVLEERHLIDGRAFHTVCVAPRR